jgi:hypothetical protein
VGAISNFKLKPEAMRDQLFTTVRPVPGFHHFLRPRRLNNGPISELHSLLNRDWFLVLSVGSLLSMVFIFSEHIQVNNGLGFDGSLYAQFARDLPHKILVEKMDGYYVQRLAIPVLLYCSSQTFGFELTDKTILRIWRGLDLFCLTMLAHLWCLIARELKISQRGKWLGVLFWFVNFAVLKWSSFYPNLTDIPAYTLGAWMLYLYLRGRSLILGLVTIVAAFNWPTAIYAGLLMLVFPRERRDDSAFAAIPRRLHAAAATLAGIGIYIVFHAFGQRWQGAYPGSLTQAPQPFLNLGILISAIYISGGLYFLLEDRRLFSITYYAGRLRTISFWIAVTVGIGTLLSQRILAPNPPLVRPQILLGILLWSSVTDPAVFLVAHVIFYGPLILLAILLWKPICQLAHDCGIGLTLSLCLMLPLSLGSESRWLFNMIPLIIPFIVKAIDQEIWQAKHYLFLVVVSMLGSKAWLTINPDWMDNLLRLNFGPWLSHVSYGVHAGIALAVGYILFTFPRPREEPQSPLLSGEEGFVVNS